MRLIDEGNPLPIIVYADLHPFAIAFPVNTDLKPLFSSVPYRIVQQVEQNRFQPKCISLNFWQVIRQIDVNDCPTFTDSNIELLKNSINASRQGYWLKVQGDLARLQMRQSQKILN